MQPIQNPTQEVALGMMHFIAIYDKSGGKEIQLSDNKFLIDGKELSPTEHELWVENTMLKTMLAQQIGENEKS